MTSVVEHLFLQNTIAEICFRDLGRPALIKTQISNLINLELLLLSTGHRQGHAHTNTRSTNAKPSVRQSLPHVDIRGGYQSFSLGLLKRTVCTLTACSYSMYVRRKHSDD